MMINENTILGLLKSVAVIVLAEEKIKKHYQEDNMKTPMHMSEGDENCVSGVVECFRNDSYFFGYYRTHSLYLSVSDNIYEFFAELHGKKTGSNGGIAGSMHMTSLKDSLLSTSAIVSSTIPLSLGAALSSRLKKDKEFSVVFFGDGAIEEGVFHEAMNIASLMQLPVVFVCLDNGLAVDVVADDRRGFKSIKQLVESYNCNYFHSPNTSAIDIFKIASDAKDSIRKTNKPAFLHLEYYRYLQHIGINSDFEESNHGFEKADYRSKEEFNEYKDRRPLTLIQESAMENGITEDKIIEILEEVQSRIDADFSMALNDDLPDPSDLYKGVF